MKLPLTQTADKSRKALEALAKNSLQNSRILVDLQQNIIRVSSGNMADNIVLTDALGRTFPLPYAHFNQWEACCQRRSLTLWFLLTSSAVRPLPHAYFLRYHDSWKPPSQEGKLRRFHSGCGRQSTHEVQLVIQRLSRSKVQHDRHSHHAKGTSWTMPKAQLWCTRSPSRDWGVHSMVWFLAFAIPKRLT